MEAMKSATRGTEAGLRYVRETQRLRGPRRACVAITAIAVLESRNNL